MWRKPLLEGVGQELDARARARAWCQRCIDEVHLLQDFSFRCFVYLMFRVQVLVFGFWESGFRLRF